MFYILFMTHFALMHVIENRGLLKKYINHNLTAYFNRRGFNVFVYYIIAVSVERLHIGFYNTLIRSRRITGVV